VAEPDRHYSREMGLTHADFWRLLPRAMGEYPYQTKGNTVHAEIAEGTLDIVLGAQQIRIIALLHLPYAEVSFTFHGVSEQGQQAFKKHFDLYFQRGGG